MRTAKPLKERILANVKITEVGCWEWQLAKTKIGYGSIKISNVGVKSTLTAHRASYAAFKGQITDGLWVLHKCHNRPCCNPDHLYLGDRAQNSRDMVESGRSLFGDRQKTFKRTPELVAGLNKLRGDGFSRKQIMAKMGIGGRTYDRIKSDGLIDPEFNRAARSKNARAARMKQLAK